MSSFQEALMNMPVFEGASDEARRRALLTAGLQMMQAPQSGFQDTLGQVSGGVAAGLQSLDQSAAREQAAQQQQFQNTIASRQVGAQEMQAGAAQTTAETGSTRAATEAAGLEEEKRQFNANKALREAKIDLDKAQAEWLRRRYDGTPLASQGDGAITAAKIDNAFIENRMENLYRADPEKYTLSDGKVNTELLMDQAFLDLHRVKGTVGNENVPIIAEGTDEAETIGQNISALQGQAPMPANAQPAQITVTTQEEIDALPSGTEFIWTDGRRYRKE